MMAPRLTSTQGGPTAWRSLFDGKSLDGWRGYKSDAVPAGWTAANGILSKETPVGDLMTKEQFGDFELIWEWKIASGGNSGVLYRGTEEYDHIYWTAPEYQLLDDANSPDGKSRLTAAASAYGLYPFPAGVVKPAGQWNSSRLVVRGAHVEHWLNDVKIEYELWSPDWTAKVAASKFKDWPDYGKHQHGYISIQGDHTGNLSVRNIRIREFR
jgi:hypothetical protein